MPQQILLNSNAPFYKENIHMHTTHSDGSETEEVMVQKYRDAGYDFVAISDHRRSQKRELLFFYGARNLFPCIERG